MRPLGAEPNPPGSPTSTRPPTLLALDEVPVHILRDRHVRMPEDLRHQIQIRTLPRPSSEPPQHIRGGSNLGRLLIRLREQVQDRAFPQRQVRVPIPVLPRWWQASFHANSHALGTPFWTGPGTEIPPDDTHSRWATSSIPLCGTSRTRLAGLVLEHPPSCEWCKGRRPLALGTRPWVVRPEDHIPVEPDHQFSECDLARDRGNRINRHRTVEWTPGRLNLQRTPASTVPGRHRSGRAPAGSVCSNRGSEARSRVVIWPYRLDRGVATLRALGGATSSSGGRDRATSSVGPRWSGGGHPDRRSSGGRATAAERLV
jgi:hypothetical protein